MRQKIQWKCPVCEDIGRYKGLCRLCSTYGDEGVLIEGIVRLKVDEEGNEWKTQDRRRGSYDLSDMKRRYLESRRRKLSRSEVKLAEREAKELHDAQEELLEDGVQDMVEIGESVNGIDEEEERTPQGLQRGNVKG